MLLLGAQLAHADVPSLFSGAQGTLSGSAGSGAIYSAGTAFELDFGSEEDESNRSGDLHLSYINQLEPSNPADLSSPSKHDENWVGGLSAHVWKRFSLGADLDHLSDTTELLLTDGVKFTLGCDPLRFSYRLARNIINTDFVTAAGANRIGAFIYQHTLSLEAELPLGKLDTGSMEADYSFFDPDAPAFADLLTTPALKTIANFQDTLQSLEEWSFQLGWKHQFGKKLDASLEGRLAHLIIAGVASYETTATVGYQLTQVLHLQAGWHYSDQTGILVQNVVEMELRYAWSRGQ
jgi:hypothetical protein